MSVVWKRSPVSAAEVFDALPKGHGWALKTVNTFLARLVEKGALAVRREGKSNSYSPLVGREECVAAEGETFLKRVFNGAAGSLVLHFAERAELTDEEIRELEQLLRSKKGSQ